MNPLDTAVPKARTRGRSRRRAAATTTVLALVGAALQIAGSPITAQAAVSVPSGCTYGDQKTTCSFGDGVYDRSGDFVVPPGVAYLDLTLDGAGGGDGGRAYAAFPVDGGGDGGSGRRVSGTLKVRPGQVLHWSRGGKGSPAGYDHPIGQPGEQCEWDKSPHDGVPAPDDGGRSAGGQAGDSTAGLPGGTGGEGDPCSGGGGGGGGGATVVSLDQPLTSPVAVAGGGGGGGGQDSSGDYGGLGGGADDEGWNGQDGAGLTPGKGGTAGGGASAGGKSELGGDQGGGGAGGGGYPKAGNGGTGGGVGSSSGGGGGEGDSWIGGAANDPSGSNLLFGVMDRSSRGRGTDGHVTISYTTPFVQIFGSTTPTTAVAAGARIAYSATVQSYSGVSVPTGRVSFTVAGTVVCSADLKKDRLNDDRAVASCKSRTTPQGLDDVQVAYTGDSAFKPATATTGTVAVEVPTYVSDTIVVLQNPIRYGATVSPKQPQSRPLSGTVTFSPSGGGHGCTAPVDADGLATCTGSAGAWGPYTATFKPLDPSASGYFPWATSSSRMRIWGR